MARAYASFTTSHNDLPHTCGVVADCRDSDVELSGPEFGALARAAHRPSAAAYGKVAIIRQGGIAVYQTDAANCMAPAYCGNATAAAMRFLNGDGESRNTVLGEPGVGYEVNARIDGRAVAQTWILPEADVEERIWRGRRVLILAMLNRYALVVGSLPDGTSAETARRELLGPGLASKLAVVAVAGATPVVEFYNANGRHGAAPQTGLASVALAVRSVPWFATLFADLRVEYRTRGGSAAHALPAVSVTQDGRLAISMPTVAINLYQLAPAEPA